MPIRRMYTNGGRGQNNANLRVVHPSSARGKTEKETDEDEEEEEQQN